MERINSLRELCKAAIDRRSVVCPKSRDFWKPRPAAFIQNLQGVIIDRLIRSGLFLYTKQGGKE